MNGEEFSEYLYEEYLYFEYKDKLEEANKEIENLKNQLQQKENIIKAARNCILKDISVIKSCPPITVAEMITRLASIIRILDKEHNEKI